MITRTHIFYFQHVHHEFGKFKNSFLQCFNLIVSGRVVKNIGIVISYKTNAGRAWRNNVISTLKILQKLGAHCFCIPSETSIVGWLSTTRLILVIHYLATALFQNLYHIKGGAGV
jgi:hypothetical protein